MSEEAAAPKPFYRRGWFIAASAVFIVLVLPRLFGFTGTESEPRPSVTIPTENTFESQGCLEVSSTLLDGIGQGFEGSTLTGRAAGHIAPEYADVRFITLEFVPNGETDVQTALFATNDDNLADKTINGLIIPVDGFALEFSDWGDAKNLELSLSDRGAAESKECLGLLEK